jgi:hypothetical protein
VATYTVPAGDVGVHVKTLVASTVDTVTFTSADLAEVEVLTNGAADIYVTFGSTKTPTVAGTQCWRIPADTVSAVLPVHTSGDTVVKLISAGTPTYSVGRT